MISDFIVESSETEWEEEKEPVEEEEEDQLAIEDNEYDQELAQLAEEGQLIMGDEVKLSEVEALKIFDDSICG